MKGFSPLFALMYPSPAGPLCPTTVFLSGLNTGANAGDSQPSSHRWQTLRKFDPPGFIPVPPHFGQSSPLRALLPLPALGTFTTFSVPSQTLHLPAGRPSTGVVRDIT